MGFKTILFKAIFQPFSRPETSAKLPIVLTNVKIFYLVYSGISVNIFGKTQGSAELGLKNTEFGVGVGGTFERGRTINFEIVE